jgi:hypothetical protein
MQCTCPYGEYRYGYTCKADGKDRPTEIGNNLCNTNNYESCPVYKAAAGK